MKIRRDFVTNSSSSSYIIIAKVNYDQELLDYMKDEYGKYGLRLLEKHLNTYGEIQDELCGWYGDDSYQYEEFCEVANNVDENTKYLMARFISWTSDGDTEDDDAWLYNHIPEKYRTDILETDPD